MGWAIRRSDGTWRSWESGPTAQQPLLPGETYVQLDSMPPITAPPIQPPPPSAAALAQASDLAAVQADATVSPTVKALLALLVNPA